MRTGVGYQVGNLPSPLTVTPQRQKNQVESTPAAVVVDREDILLVLGRPATHIAERRNAQRQLVDSQAGTTRPGYVLLVGIVVPGSKVGHETARLSGIDNDQSLLATHRTGKMTLVIGGTETRRLVDDRLAVGAGTDGTLVAVACISRPKRGREAVLGFNLLSLPGAEMDHADGRMDRLVLHRLRSRRELAKGNV
jgi:hypothetical protein